MIRIVMLRRNGATLGFECSGHAGYAEAGSDIVCSAVSALTAATANGLTEAAKIGYTALAWPKQYLSGKTQMETLFAREKAQQSQPAYKEPA